MIEIGSTIQLAVADCRIWSEYLLLASKEERLFLRLRDLRDGERSDGFEVYDHGVAFGHVMMQGERRRSHKESHYA